MSQNGLLNELLQKGEAQVADFGQAKRLPKSADFGHGSSSSRDAKQTLGGLLVASGLERVRMLAFLSVGSGCSEVSSVEEIRRNVLTSGCRGPGANALGLISQMGEYQYTCALSKSLYYPRECRSWNNPS